MWGASSVRMGTVAVLCTIATACGDDEAGPTPVVEVTLPPAGEPFDYQLGGSYEPADDVQVVSRDREEPSDPSRYSICYVNGFQTQPDEADRWRGNDGELLLRDDVGQPVVDPNWPDEWILDISTEANRDRLVDIVGEWIEGCADDGFEAVEIDNLDTFTRFPEDISEDDAAAYAAALVERAHDAELAIGQKNTAELLERRDELGFDFVVVERCNEYDECDLFLDEYGERTLVIEYDADAFASGCDRYPGLAVILRDRDLSTPAASGYVREVC